jgi:hypothetical protein
MNSPTGPVSTPVLPESRLDEKYPPRDQLYQQHAPPSGTCEEGSGP